MEVYFVRICLTQRVCTHTALVIVASASPSLPGYAAETASGRHFRHAARGSFAARHLHIDRVVVSRITTRDGGPALQPVRERNGKDVQMKLRKLVVALAALSFAGAAAAAGNTTGSTANNSSNDQMTTRQTSPQSTQNENGTSATHPMGSSQGSAAQGTASSQGGASQSATPGEESNTTTVREAQQALKDQGFNVGSVDGQMGPTTESALRNFQQSKKLPQTGNLDQQTLSALGVNENGASSQGSQSSQGASSISMSSNHGASKQDTSTQNSAYK